MAKDDNVQYNFRLNLNNPNHLKLYRVLSDLNTDIHKSKTSFIISALLYYIGVKSDVELTNTGAKELAERKGFATREELDELEKRITINVMKEVGAMMSKAVLANQAVFNNNMMQQYMNMPQANSSNSENCYDNKMNRDETTDATLEEMSLMFANGDFGEEM